MEKMYKIDKGFYRSKDGRLKVWLSEFWDYSTRTRRARKVRYWSYSFENGRAINAGYATKKEAVKAGFKVIDA